MPQSPSVGRVVHYQSYGTPGGEFMPQPRAAIVTQVADDGETVGLFIMNPTGVFFPTAVKHAADDAPTPGCWNWPPYVPAKPIAQPVQQSAQGSVGGLANNAQQAANASAAALSAQQPVAAAPSALPVDAPVAVASPAPDAQPCSKCAGAGCMICAVPAA